MLMVSEGVYALSELGYPTSTWSIRSLAANRYLSDLFTESFFPA